MEKNQSVQKAVSILRAAALRSSGATIAELARAAQLPRPTGARLVATLVDEGLLARRDGGDTYVLGHEMARLGSLADLGRHIIESSRGALEHVMSVCEETVMLQLPRNGQIEVVLQLDPPKLLGGTNWVGLHFPLYASSAGKLLIASWGDDSIEATVQTPRTAFTPRTITDPAAFRHEIERVREDGYAVVLDELEMGLSSVSVPVRDAMGALVAIVSVCAPTARLGPEERRLAVSTLSEAAQLIGQLRPKS